MPPPPSAAHHSAGKTLRSYAKLCFFFFFFLRNSVCGSGKHKPEKEKVEAGRARQTKHLGEKTSLIRGARCSAPPYPPSLSLFVRRSSCLFGADEFRCCRFGEPSESFPHDSTARAGKRTTQRPSGGRTQSVTPRLSSSSSLHLLLRPPLCTKRCLQRFYCDIKPICFVSPFSRRLFYLPVRFPLRAASSLIRQN